jgi:signal transduction histidine kinase
MNVLPSFACPEQADNLTKITQLCQLQLEQLINQLPVVAGRLTARHPSHQRLEVFYCKQSLQSATHLSTPLNSGLLLSFLADLESEPWFPQRLSALIPQAIAVTPPSGIVDAKRDNSTVNPRVNPTLYLCGLETASKQPDYLLLYTDQSLTIAQQQQIKQAASILSRIFDLEQESWKQRNEAAFMEQVLYRAEHQLRNPLGLIGLYAENLYLTVANDTHKHQVDVIRNTVANLSNHLSNLMRCGQPASFQFEICNLLKVWLNAVTDLRHWLESKRIHLEFPTVSVPLLLDAWQMQQVFHNILDNAIHFSATDSTITCQWHVYQKEVLITIADQGPGLNYSDLQKVFTPFYSRRPGGTGLGLAIAQKIVLEHRGHLWAENLPEKGAMFCISLPRGEAYTTVQE